MGYGKYLARDFFAKNIACSCYQGRGEVSYEEALAAYERAIQLDPNNANAYAKKGDTLSKLKNKGGIGNSFRKRKEAEQAYKLARQLGYSCKCSDSMREFFAKYLR